jgi:hypothetical protein
MSNCYKCGCSCNKMKFVKGGYVSPSTNCSRSFSFKNCKKEIIAKEELPDIFLSNNEMVELSPANTEIGLLTNGVREKGSFFLHSDFAGQNDNDKFIIKGNKLKSKQILYYVPGVTYKVTVRYTGLKYYKQKDFDIIVASSKYNAELQEGEQVQVSSSDYIIDLTFDNVTTPGEVFFTPMNLPSNDLFMFDINTTAEFDGNITVSFNNENINPENNPVIFHLRYDEELEEVFYEDVTTEVLEGKINGVVNSLSPFAVWFTAPPDAWGAAPNCGFTLDFTPPPPCPGNQYRGSWAITEDGVGPPRLLGGACGCWEPSIVTVDAIIGAATAVGAAKAGICGIVGNISTLRSTIQSAVSQIVDFQDIINIGRGVINYARSQMEALMDQVRPLFIQATTNDGYIAAKRILLDQADDYQTILRLETEIRELQQTNSVLRQQAQVIIRQRDSIGEQVANSVREVELAEAGKATAEAGLVSNRAALEGAETTLSTRLGELAASTIALYAFLNEVSVQKTCPNGQTLNPLTCECCPNCTGGKVFPDPMNNCDCQCPADKEPCFSLGNENCYDPCGAGQIRVGSDCRCSCVDGSKELCGDQCYDPCPPDHTRESDCSCSPYTPFMFSSKNQTMEW